MQSVYYDDSHNAYKYIIFVLLIYAVSFTGLMFNFFKKLSTRRNNGGNETLDTIYKDFVERDNFRPKVPVYDKNGRRMTGTEKLLSSTLSVAGIGIGEGKEDCPSSPVQPSGDESLARSLSSISHLESFPGLNRKPSFAKSQNTLLERYGSIYEDLEVEDDVEVLEENSSLLLPASRGQTPCVTLTFSDETNHYLTVETDSMSASKPCTDDDDEEELPTFNLGRRKSFVGLNDMAQIAQHEVEINENRKSSINGDQERRPTMLKSNLSLNDPSKKEEMMRMLRRPSITFCETVTVVAPPTRRSSSPGLSGSSASGSTEGVLMTTSQSQECISSQTEQSSLSDSLQVWKAKRRKIQTQSLLNLSFQGEPETLEPRTMSSNDVPEESNIRITFDKPLYTE